MSWSVNLEEAESLQDYPVYPKGSYEVVISDANLVEKEPGKLQAVIKYIISKGEFKGKALTDFLFVQHPSAQCQKIGIGKLKKIGECVGVTDTVDATVLENDFPNNQLILNVAEVAHYQDPTQKQNKITHYKSLNMSRVVSNDLDNY